jgi:hypothetical protein
VSPIEALHTAARRYCENRAALAPSAVLDAIRWEVEAFTPADFSSLAEAREVLVSAGETAESVLTRPPLDESVRNSMDVERALFAEYVRDLSEDELAPIEPLPFRRTLTAEESRRLWSELEARWGVEWYWYPLDRTDTEEPPPNAVALNDDEFYEDEVQVRLRDVLAGLGVSRVLELRELLTGAECEIDLELFEPIYTGEGEGFWTDGSLDWLIYASHEGSVTVAGAQLLPAFKKAFPEWPDWIYT